jgi:hypothetical protein
MTSALSAESRRRATVINDYRPKMIGMEPEIVMNMPSAEKEENVANVKYRVDNSSPNSSSTQLSFHQLNYIVNKKRFGCGRSKEKHILHDVRWENVYISIKVGRSRNDTLTHF